MRYQTYKKPKGKTEKQKKINKEKKSKGPKINAMYKDTSPYNVAGVDINLTVLRYGIIDSCNVTSITVNDEVIPLKNSWVEAVLIMFDTLVENYPDSYIQKCIEFEITGQDLVLDEYYGKYNFDGINYKAYKLYNRELYVESTFNYDCIFRALVGLTKALDIKLDEIQFHVIGKDYKESRLNYASVSKGEKIVNVDELFNTLNLQGHHLVSMKLFDSVIEVHRIDVVLIAFCNIMYDTLGDDIELLGGNDSSGICRTGDPEYSNTMAIRGSHLSVYSDLDTLGIIEFMQESLGKVNQTSNELKFKFEFIDLDAPKHEWEID